MARGILETLLVFVYFCDIITLFSGFCVQSRSGFNVWRRDPGGFFLFRLKFVSKKNDNYLCYTNIHYTILLVNNISIFFTCLSKI